MTQIDTRQTQIREETRRVPHKFAMCRRGTQRTGDCEHVTLEVENTIVQAQLHPPESCCATCRGLKQQQQLDASGLPTLGAVKQMSEEDIRQAIQEPNQFHVGDDWARAWDGATGRALKPDLVRRARQEEIAYFKMLYTKGSL